MTPTRKVTAATLIFWFKARYEDAAESVFYEGREGGYQYAPGAGPVDPADALRSEFPNASNEVLAEAVGHLSSEAGAWVKKSQY